MSRPSKTDRARMALLGLFLLLTPACEQKMAHQPYFRPLERTSFYEDNRSARPLEDGVIARGQFLSDDPLVTGLTPDVMATWLKSRGGEEAADEAAPADGDANEGMVAAQDEADEAPAAGNGRREIEPAPDAPSDVAKFVDAFPFEITKQDLLRGAERYTIFCVACHGPLGDGRGKIWERGYLQPTSFLEGNSRGFDRWRVSAAMNPYNLGDAEGHAPVGYYFEVITKGYGGMPNYASQIKPADRWRIIAYVRALQLSRGADLGDLPEEQQNAAREQLGRSDGEQ